MVGPDFTKHWLITALQCLLIVMSPKADSPALKVPAGTCQNGYAISFLTAKTYRVKITYILNSGPAML